MIDVDNQHMQDIADGFQIPVKPQILVEMQEVEATGDPSPKAYADVISKDVALSAAVLKVVNSPAFGLQRTVTDIRQSIVFLGNQNITNLVSFFQLKDSFKGDSSINLEKYWDKAMDTANMMTVLVEHLSLKSECPTEDAYAFGLFRDCGIPLMAMKYDDYNKVISERDANHERVFTDIEEEHYPSNHAIIGYFLANSWHLPKHICKLILRHHEEDYLVIQKEDQTKRHLYALAKLASNVLSRHQTMQDDSEWLLAKDSVLGFLGISDMDYEELEEDIKEQFSIQFG